MYTLGALAQLVSGKVQGDDTIVIEGVASAETAEAGRITFATNARTLAAAAESEAAAVIVAKDAAPISKPVIRTDNPRLAFAKVLELFEPKQNHPEHISPSACIAEDAVLGDGTAIGHHAHIGPGTSLGDRVIVYPGVYVGADVVIGSGSILYPGVTVLDRVHIGERVILHPGAVIGSDGFGYVPVEGRHYKVPQIGTVVIEDDVEIGVNAAVARATMGETRVGKGTKIDGHVYVAHNVQVGANVIVAGMSAMAGSAIIEDDVTLAGQTGVAGHLTIGKGAIVGARGLILGDVPAGSFVSGSPARPHRETMRIAAATRRLPELLQTVTRLERHVAELQADIGEADAARTQEDSDGEDDR